MVTNGQAVANVPRVGEWFEVNPQTINRQLFKERREDKRQECTRQLILEAFAAVDGNPEYARGFETMVPKKTWKSSGNTVRENKEIASELGDRMANWIEEALEWAQRLTNGESWSAVCNGWDGNDFHRMITWKNGFARVVGAALKSGIGFCSTSVLEEDFDDERRVGATVPKVVRYKT